MNRRQEAAPLVGLPVLVLLAVFRVAVPAIAQEEDPYLWLEEVEGDEALGWVREQNERSLGEVTAHPLYENNLELAMDLATDDERIPYGTIRDGMVYMTSGYGIYFHMPGNVLLAFAPD